MLLNMVTVFTASLSICRWRKRASNSAPFNARFNSPPARTVAQSIVMTAQLSIGTRRIDDESRTEQEELLSNSRAMAAETEKRLSGRRLFIVDSQESRRSSPTGIYSVWKFFRNITG